MIKELVHDPLLLSRASSPAGENDLQTARDLLDTLAAHREECAGMAANMIGVYKQIIVFQDGGSFTVMLNPKILSASGPFEAEEGCLSLLGGPRRTKRFRKIRVSWQNESFETRIKTFSGWTAQVIQHEIDHCSGVLI